ncbi:A.superbus venom factor 1-like isoform X2 [Emydura macquarii macquarii]|uniref:A.superbus venom factor 1-like isoform X2 n=1 Tax=Emydura macquarii macquarii TaxID=1129001 RepID=UPI00352B7927
MAGFILYLVAFCLPGVSHSQLYTLITPNVLRVQSEEKIVVEAHGLSTPIEVTVTVRDFTLKRLLYEVKTNLNPENGMMNTAIIKVPSEGMEKVPKQNQYVFIQAQSTHFILEKVVLVFFHSGYIFIQLDKAFYTPGSTVFYQISAMDHKLKPVSKTMTVYVENPGGVFVKKDRVRSSSTGIIAMSYTLPEVADLGIWKIVAKYEDSPQQTFNTQFDVKEYVLPSFEVMLEPSEKFFYINGDKDFRVTVSASFLYGKKVEGTAFVLFGVKMNNEKKSILKSLQRIWINNGSGEAVLTKVMLQAQFPNLSELLGHSIYISVIVLRDSGRDIMEAERGGINIVTSPYQIHFTKTPKYFKPGMPFELMVYVTNPDGSSAPRIPVEAEGFKSGASTEGDGTAKLVLNMPVDRAHIPITVKTALKNLPENRQASTSMMAEAYQTQGESKNYLHLAVFATNLKPNNNLLVNFNLKSDNLGVLNQIQYFTYLILNKGNIVRVGRQARQVGQIMVTMSLPITPDLLPSFRIVAYYHVGQEEIVADAVWVDLQDTCMGTLAVKVVPDMDSGLYTPGAPIKIKVEGDAGTRVRLVTLDKGVYIRNKQYRIAQTKIWDTIEKSDIGCGPGSGKDGLGVFADAGLALATNTKISTPSRTDPKCPQPAKRNRRSAQRIELKSNKAVQHEDQALKKCCEDGMYENPLGYSCEKRAEYILNADECKQAFLNCCHSIKTAWDRRKRGLHVELARSDLNEHFLSDEDITSRSQFPERGLWHMEHLNEAANELGISSKMMHVFLNDSIITWEVLAVSFSDSKGICVADPYEIKVMKEFFIDLQLPYSVVQNEQVEIRAILYNYQDHAIKVRVTLMYSPAFCSTSTSTAKYQQILTIEAMSFQAVPLVLVPLQLGIHDIEVKAAVWDRFMADGVKKKLKVVPERMRIAKKVLSFVLDPAGKGVGGVQEMKVGAANPDDIVPNTELETSINIQGNPVILENLIDGGNLRHLIVRPSGSGEENLLNMTLTVTATHYLDTTRQWEQIGVDRRVEAIRLIMQGYTQQMSYKKPNHSYAALQTRPASTWLTAYVERVFTMASKLVTVEAQILCEAVKWLILEKQKSNGVFQEDAPVIHQEMMGGYKGAEPDISLTAFVLVAMLDVKDFCKNQVNSLEGSISKAAEYLAKGYRTLTRPYMVALTSYALALAGKLDNGNVLMKASKDGNHWEEQGSRTISIEGTAYALLALLHLKEFELAGPVVTWLVEQKYYGGGFDSTQAIFIMFQALAQYQIEAQLRKDLHLTVSISTRGRAYDFISRISHDNTLVSTTMQQNTDFTVKAQGTGTAVVTVMSTYNAKLQEGEFQCKKFDLKVSLREAQHAKKSYGALRSVSITICTRYLGDSDATMPILDISMLTGFSPDVEDLARLSQGHKIAISKSEMNKTSLDRSTLLIYLDKVSQREEDCLTFKAHQFVDVDLIQPASVTIYDYDSIDDRCTKFYHLSEKSGLLSKICHRGVCRCTEGKCFMQDKMLYTLNLEKRVEAVCKLEVDYVYKTRLIKMEELSGHDSYVMEVLEIIKEGTETYPKGINHTFMSPRKCRESLKLELNKDYLIWGPRSDVWAVKSDISYVFSSDTWIEKWPTEEECRELHFQSLCQELAEFSETMILFGCLS